MSEKPNRNASVVGKLSYNIVKIDPDELDTPDGSDTGGAGLHRKAKRAIFLGDGDDVRGANRIREGRVRSAARGLPGGLRKEARAVGYDLLYRRGLRIWGQASTEK